MLTAIILTVLTTLLVAILHRLGVILLTAFAIPDAYTTEWALVAPLVRWHESRTGKNRPRAAETHRFRHPAMFDNLAYHCEHLVGQFSAVALEQRSDALNLLFALSFFTQNFNSAHFFVFF